MSNATIYFDVDETLIGWEPDLYDEKIVIHGVTFGVHRPHVNKLIQHGEVGDTIVVWSAGGGDWAYAVCKELRITEYIHTYLSKPHFYYDDKELKDFNCGRIYLDLKGNISEGCYADLEPKKKMRRLLGLND